MNSEGLKTELAQAPNAVSFIEQAWETSAKNAVARGYMAGVLDAFNYSGAISNDQLDAFYARFVYGRN